MTIHEQILEVVEAYKTENEKFVTKGVKAAAVRARNTLSDLAKLCKQRRDEIQEDKQKV